MSRYTAAYSNFIDRLQEVDALRRLAAAKERANPIGDKDTINALCRGAIVLLSAHLEAFVKDLGEVALDSMSTNGVGRKTISPRLYYYISQDVLGEIQQTSDPHRIAEKVFAFIDSDLPFWSKTGPFPVPVPTERFNKGFANPAFAKIKKYFNRFGYSGYQNDVMARLKGSYLATTNMVDHLVDTRNKIAHGDPSATKTPAEVRGMASTIRAFCMSTDDVFAAWWKGSFCSIR